MVRGLVMQGVVWAAWAGLAMPACETNEHEAAPRPPAGGVSLLADSVASFRLVDNSAGRTLGAMKLVAVDGMPFRTALWVRTARDADHEARVVLSAPLRGTVREKDMLWLRVYLRGAELQAAAYLVQMGISIHRTPGAPLRALKTQVTAGSTWQRYDFPVTMPATYPEGSGVLQFWLGYAAQAVEIGGVELLHYGTNVAAGALPMTKFSYAGRAADAAWRARALENIRRHRMGTVRVRVTGTNGTAVAGARVALRMKRHAFVFGTCISDYWLFSPPAGPEERQAKQAYWKRVKQHFNHVTIGGGMLWNSWEQTNRREQVTLPGLRWLRREGMPVRATHLVWGGWQWLPKDVHTLTNDPWRLRHRINTHIREQMRACQGLVRDWNVVNEPVTQNELTKVLGNSAIAEWFKTARAMDGKALLWINDYPMPHGWHMNAYTAVIQRALADGAPIDGIGIQGHVSVPLPGPEEWLAAFDILAAFGKRIEITEFDVLVADEELQAEYTRDFLLVCMSHPAVQGVTMWGMGDADHWKKNAVLYRGDWTLKPSGEEWVKLVEGEWKTRTNGVTDAAGEFVAEGFHGVYDVQIEAGAVRKTRTVRLRSGTQDVTIEMN